MSQTAVLEAQEPHLGREVARRTLCKVPEVTVWFWVIKVLCTTVGETFADFLGTNLHLGLSGSSVAKVTSLGLSGTTYVMVPFLVVALVFQFRARRYIPGIYWLSVVLISVVGTLVTDNMVENFGVSLPTSTIIFSIALAVTFLAWYSSEKTLSIHSIYTTRREAFYWLTILFTFALGTAAGDLLAEKMALGYLPSAFIFAGVIGLAALGYAFFKLNGVLAFWIAYVLTRPLGASIGDLLSQPRHPTPADVAAGNFPGLGLGPTWTSFLFLSAILGVVVYLTRSKADVEELTEPHLREKVSGLITAAADVLGPDEKVLAAGVFALQDHQGAAMVSDLATVGAARAAKTAGRNAASLEEQALRRLVVVTQGSIHVLDWDGAGHAAQKLASFTRENTVVQVTKVGLRQHLNLADMDSDRRIGLTGATSPFGPDASGDRLVVHLLGDHLSNDRLLDGAA